MWGWEDAGITETREQKRKFTENSKRVLCYGQVGIVCHDLRNVINSNFLA